MKKFLIGLALLVLASASPALANSQEALTSIENSIQNDQSIGAHDINIHYRQRTVFLSGVVGSEATSAEIERIAMNAPHVRQVQNGLVVQPERFAMGMQKTMSSTTDEELLSTINNRLASARDINTETLQIEVNSGNVTIAGDQSSTREVDRTLATLLNVRGVRDISNNITVNGRPYPTGNY